MDTASEAVTETDQTTTPETTTATDAPWYSNLSPEYHDNENITGYNSADDFAKSHLNMVSQLGSSVSIPGEGASDEDMAAFYTKLGRPETFGEYSFTGVDGADPDATLVETFAPAFHKAGLNQTQTNAINEVWNEYATAQNAKLHADIEASKNDLSKDLGKPFESLQEEATNTLKQLGGEDFIDLLENNPPLVRLINNIKGQFSEDSLPEQNPQSSMSMDDARKEYNEILADLSKRDNPMDPEYQRLNDRLKVVAEVVHGK